MNQKYHVYRFQIIAINTPTHNLNVSYGCPPPDAPSEPNPRRIVNAQKIDSLPIRPNTTSPVPGTVQHSTAICEVHVSVQRALVTKSQGCAAQTHGLRTPKSARLAASQF